jgi:hypothetical protein
MRASKSILRKKSLSLRAPAASGRTMQNRYSYSDNALQ